MIHIPEVDFKGGQSSTHGLQSSENFVQLGVHIGQWTMTRLAAILHPNRLLGGLGRWRIPFPSFFASSCRFTLFRWFSHGQQGCQVSTLAKTSEQFCGNRLNIDDFLGSAEGPVRHCWMHIKGKTTHDKVRSQVEDKIIVIGHFT